MFNIFKEKCCYCRFCGEKNIYSRKEWRTARCARCNSLLDQIAFIINEVEGDSNHDKILGQIIIENTKCTIVDTWKDNENNSFLLANIDNDVDFYMATVNDMYYTNLEYDYRPKRDEVESDWIGNFFFSNR